MIYSEKKVILEKEPRLNIIIPSKDNIDYLLDCLDSIIDISMYSNMKVIIADTGSNQQTKKELIEYIKNNKNELDLELVEYNYYNFAKINNDVVKNHVEDTCELLLFCNDDIYLLNDAISHCVKTYIEKSDVGTVGARLHFENKLVQHNGIFIIPQQNSYKIGHYDFKNKSSKNSGISKIIGNTGAFLLVSKKDFLNVNMFNTTYLECFEDVEFNLKIKLSGKENYMNYSACAFHFESISRKKSNEKNNREAYDYYNVLIPFLNKNKNEIWSEL